MSNKFQKYALEVLGNESEGVVRREAVGCIAQIYQHREIPEQSLDTVFSVLAHCAVNDFYWEVKVNALDFWNLVIIRQFEYQGMINGSFPLQTFSKEKKKIVTLNEKEIQLRLHKVLNELSLRGCLGILIACLQDSDLEVIRKVVTVVENMMAHFLKYNFFEEYKRMKQKEGETSSFRPVVDSNYSEVKSMFESVANVETQVRNAADFNKTTVVTVSQENGEICSDLILDSIRNSDDITLLSNTYKENLSLNQEPCNTGKIDENLFKKFATVSPNNFLDFVNNTNLKEVLNERSEWLHHTETFSTLLDDVLQSFGQSVDLDCY
jgi:BRCA1-associated ATM activator 1